MDRSLGAIGAPRHGTPPGPGHAGPASGSTAETLVARPGTVPTAENYPPISHKVRNWPAFCPSSASVRSSARPSSSTCWNSSPSLSAASENRVIEEQNFRSSGKPKMGGTGCRRAPGPGSSRGPRAGRGQAADRRAGSGNRGGPERAGDEGADAGAGAAPRGAGGGVYHRDRAEAAAASPGLAEVYRQKVATSCRKRWRPRTATRCAGRSGPWSRRSCWCRRTASRQSRSAGICAAILALDKNASTRREGRVLRLCLSK